MNSELPNSPEDRLLDELLREQTNGPDEAFLQQIEQAIDAGPPLAKKLPAPRRYGRLAIAAGIGLVAGISFYYQLESRDAHKNLIAARERTDAAAANEKERQELDKAIRDQEDKVEERRKLLAMIVRTKGIISKGQDSFYGQSGVDEDQGARTALRTFNELEQNKMQLESQINSLLKYNSDQAMTYAAGIDVPDNVTKRLLPQYQEANREMEKLNAQGLGKNSPTADAKAEELHRMKTQLDEEVVNVRASLQAQLEMTTDRLKTVEVVKDDSRDQAIKRGLDAQDYVDAKKDYEIDQKLLIEMKSRQALNSPSKGQVASAEISPGSVASSSTEFDPNLPPLPALASNERDEAAGAIVGGNKPSAGKGTGSGAGLGGGEALVRQQESTVMLGRGADSSDKSKRLAGGIAITGGHEFPSKTSAPEQNTGDRYGTFIDQPWKSPANDPLSTFSIDVDTASYANVRRMIREGREIPRDAVRIEEFINAFKYQYAAPKGDGPFAVGADLAVCPWAPNHQLVRVSIKGRDIEAGKRPASNLVFLIDVSGSMQSPDKLPLLKQSMVTMVSQLDERDRVAIVVYAGSEGVALPSTRLDEEGRAKVLAALTKLDAGGSTNGGAGIKRAYELAMEQKIAGGVNRVILATDGDFNVGVTGQEALVKLVKDRAKSGVYLTVAGFGSGNLNDAMMDAITRDGNGNYFYIDSEREGRKVFLQNLAGTLVTIAKDVKIQVEFNPAKVGSYRLIGYANRVLRNEDFSNDKVDAGDIGAGHTVTAFYELTPPGATPAADDLKYQAVEKPATTDDWLTVKLRHKHPEGNESSLIEFPLTGNPSAMDQTDRDFQFATAAALLGMKLRGMEEVKEISWSRVIALAKPSLANDVTEDRAEFVELVKMLNEDKSPDSRPQGASPPAGKAEVIPTVQER